MEIVVLQEERLSLILMVDLQDMAAELSQERTVLRLTVVQHMQQDMLRRMLLHQEQLRDVRFSYHMQ